jgi:hypothetical protein
MATRPRPTLLTIPREIRDVIYEHATTTDDVYQVCQCPAHTRNSLGLCDFRRRPDAIHELDAARNTYSSGDALPAEDRPPPSNIKAKLALVCQQMKVEAEPFQVKFPTLVFCDPLCFHDFMKRYNKTRIVDLLHRVEIVLNEEAQEDSGASSMAQAAYEYADIVQQWHLMWLVESMVEIMEASRTGDKPAHLVGKFVLEREHPDPS